MLHENEEEVGKDSGKHSTSQHHTESVSYLPASKFYAEIHEAAHGADTGTGPLNLQKPTCQEEVLMAGKIKGETAERRNGNKVSYFLLFKSLLIKLTGSHCLILQWLPQTFSGLGSLGSLI